MSYLSDYQDTLIDNFATAFSDTHPVTLIQ